ncbi:TusE/DsrC/DsvC family sulfur relay protein [candidate division KSB1 bacterium]|nr:TusE/DsrC/DsvC family sulfur relay protein [candidate division KSB1 bacterium]
MSSKEIAGRQINVDNEGFLTDPEQWDKEIANQLAAEEGIPELKEDHWKVIEFMRKDYKENAQIPTIRRMKKVGGIDTKMLYELFPKGPAKKAARISGLSKPQGCV